ncbi:MAG: hypothetical protein PHG14_14260 [Desulfobacter postgatei]|uniref:hypothetical protein n=1 Tax=Desulfobacter postgatei TaxID=2293 RepID=UPI0023F4820F|nr:hypothetical protein [Desulfobacter postgatei]MDD4274875.1 hypothetical protein [Desulfobacter postgatei]
MKTNLKLNISFIFKMVSLMLVCIINLYSSKLILNKNKFALIMAPMRDSNVSILYEYKFTDSFIPTGETFCYFVNVDNYEKNLNFSILYKYKFTDAPIHIGETFSCFVNADNYEKDLNFIKAPLTISEIINTLFSIDSYTDKLCYNNWGVDNFTVIPKDLFNGEAFIKINPYDSIAIRDDAIEFSDSKVPYCFLPNLFLYGSDHTQTCRAVLLKLTAISKFT